MHTTFDFSHGVGGLAYLCDLYWYFFIILHQESLHSPATRAFQFDFAIDNRLMQSGHFIICHKY